MFISEKMLKDSKYSFEIFKRSCHVSKCFLVIIKYDDTEQKPENKRKAQRERQVLTMYFYSIERRL